MSSISYRRNQPLQEYVAIAAPPMTAPGASPIGLGPGQWAGWVNRGAASIN